MSAHDQTVDQAWSQKAGGPRARPVPGLVLVSSAGRPVYAAVAIGDKPFLLERGRFAEVTLEDGCMSRRHAEVAREGGAWVLRDLDSRNGSALDGEVWKGERRASGDHLLRVGDTLVLLREDVRPYLERTISERDALTVGPVLAQAWDHIADAAQGGETLHVTGESGSGKELAARHFHASSPRGRGPFVAVNCAAIPSAIAERLLFGAKRGAYSGADADADGYVQAADGGTLFLDEIAELDLQVQAKLLRVLETREVTPLGAARARKVSLGVVSATHSALRGRVEEGRFREDLFFRIGRPQVALPALRERREEIPSHVEAALGKAGAPPAHASLVEAVLLRPWPGNVRELFVELREAARVAQRRGAARVEAQDLDLAAGQERTARERPPMPAEVASRGPNVALPPRAELEEALRRHAGNVAQTARALGVHRTQLRRWLERYEVDPRLLGVPSDDNGDGEA